MGHTFTNHLYHIVFSTKHRKGLLEDRRRTDFHQYLCGFAQTLDCAVLSVNSVGDHIHLLVRIRPSLAVSEFVGKLKANSSRWIKEQMDPPFGFQWQSGFSSFTVSQSAAAQVRDYIERQTEHHRQLTFEEELKRFLERNGFEYDPQRCLD
ncbi:MAG TPA: IS200/IS605 family transposase [Anaerohalosphaeraceae bacterium]|nr:IS200/IS605 family transposase [Anaerohalosphaeraceae bacterium]HOL89419.1 IS200/IS605 family transposase [Anaerohalosphaeraceae bacterium]HPP55615.1 IS200/IS605 family transposase [Anaerohalosphaeraceae bacterium]